ncbi:unnamed protein product [Rotaria sp. Silwood2]|nr:unnamed protein product [Rotaria sp. Silwood2]CAF2695321.1 unnamed protein product [Rotaria sp. Silwood2]CAF2959161.1 unnamed protein product [Rotaria sp. Silwood2]CAF3114939.1 unnamed protein product [Rotaria sp. Silwood2]CAF3992869.1 unnamed protein product [Rotaria sp. Silwood2]
MHRSHYIELRLLLTCFYIYLNCQTILHVKLVIFHNSLLSSPFTHPYTYIHIRAIIGGCVSLVYRCLLLYAIWRKMADLLLISIIFLTALTCLRIIFDFYGYFSGYIKQSLYYPFDSFDKKSMAEEIIDLIFALIQNSFGLILSIYMLDGIMNDSRARRTMRELNRQSIQSEQY